MTKVRPKKHLGQHFLKDQNIARKIVGLLQNIEGLPVIEIGPGMGVLTGFLTEQQKQVFAYEVDRDSVAYLATHLNRPNLTVREEDFLNANLYYLGANGYCLIGNLPYNISSQIFFKMLDERAFVKESVFMIQKEVAERIASPPGNKTYGILSVLLQAFFDIHYEFTVEPHVFVPPPKVRSGVIRLTRNQTIELDCDEKLFFRVVKQGFNNRRKTLRNALKSLNLPTSDSNMAYFDKRAEQLSVNDFVDLVKNIETEI